MSEYVVLREYANDGDKPIKPAWRTVWRGEARDANDAIRVACKNEAGTFIAVPARSWQPRKVTVETKPSVKVEAAT